MRCLLPHCSQLSGPISCDIVMLSLRYSTLLFQPQAVSPHKQHAPIEHLARGRLWVDSWSIFGQFQSKMTKTDRKPTQKRPFPESRQVSTPKKRGGSVAEIKVSMRYPISCDTSQTRAALPQNGAIPPLVLSFTQTRLCDTPFCNGIVR